MQNNREQEKFNFFSKGCSSSIKTSFILADRPHAKYHSVKSTQFTDIF